MWPPVRASQHTRVAAIVVAAGSGERLGAEQPKAFVELAGRPMVVWSLDALAAAGIRHVVIAVPPGYATGPLGHATGPPGHATAPPADVTLVEGGATRSASVRNALDAVGDADAVVVHDAARPLVTPELFERTLAALEGADAAIAAARVTDTIKEAGADGLVVRTHDRSRLWAVQTPQAFRTTILRRALDVPAGVLAAATDDAWLIERAGGSVRVVESAPANFKVTTPHDLALAASLLC